MTKGKGKGSRIPDECLRCNGTGHQSYNCPTARGSTDQTVCKGCNGKGHKWAQCPTAHPHLKGSGKDAGKGRGWGGNGKGYGTGNGKGSGGKGKGKGKAYDLDMMGLPEWGHDDWSWGDDDEWGNGIGSMRFLA